MALKLYLKKQFNSAVGVSGSTPTYQYASLVRSVLAFTTAVTNTVASGSNIQMTQTAGGTLVSWISPPVAGQFTMTGTVTMNLWAFESNALANATVQVRFCKLSAAGILGAAFMTSSFGTELGTSAAACNWTATPSDTIFNNGDRLVIFVDVTNATAQTMGGSQTVTLDYAGLTVGADGDSWVSFTQAINFSTSFPATENPISQGGIWLNGATNGIDWNDCQTTPGFFGGVPPSPVDFSDPTAVLHPTKTGPWQPNQYARATVFSSGTDATKFKEVELRLNTTISAHSIQGYELDFGMHLNPFFSGGPAKGVSIVRWNGPRGNAVVDGNNNNNGFTDITSWAALITGVVDGDVIEGINVGGVISAFINGVLVAQGVDTTYRAGTPGIGVDSGCDPLYATFGLKDFLAENVPFQSEPEFIQQATGSSGAATSASATFAGVCAAGNLLVAAPFWDQSVARTATLTDGGDIFSPLPPNSIPSAGFGGTNPNAAQMFFSDNIVGGTAPTVVVTLSGASASFIALNVNEYAGMAPAPLDVATTPVQSTSATSLAAGPAVTHFSNELLFVVALNTGAGAPSIPNGYVSRNQAATGLQDSVVAAKGTYSPSVTVSPAQGLIVMMSTFLWASQAAIVPPDYPGAAGNFIVGRVQTRPRSEFIA